MCYLTLNLWRVAGPLVIACLVWSPHTSACWSMFTHARLSLVHLFKPFQILSTIQRLQSYSIIIITLTTLLGGCFLQTETFPSRGKRDAHQTHETHRTYQAPKIHSWVYKNSKQLLGKRKLQGCYLQVVKVVTQPRVGFPWFRFPSPPQHWKKPLPYIPISSHSKHIGFPSWTCAQLFLCSIPTFLKSRITRSRLHIKSHTRDSGY